MGGCTDEHCCLMPTTTPKAPCTTVLPATSSPGPCTTAAHRLYSAGQQVAVQQAVAGSQDSPSAAQTWALPALGLFAGIAMAAGMGASVYRRSRRTGARQVQSTCVL